MLLVNSIVSATFYTFILKHVVFYRVITMSICQHALLFSLLVLLTSIETVTSNNMTIHLRSKRTSESLPESGKETIMKAKRVKKKLLNTLDVNDPRPRVSASVTSLCNNEMLVLGIGCIMMLNMINK